MVLASGRGTNFAAICDAVQKKQLPKIKITGLICNKKDAGALEHAKRFGVPSQIIESKLFLKGGKLDRDTYEKALSEALRKLGPNIICLAGYMLLLGPKLVNEWEGKIINIHPSLLPNFRGLRAQHQAIEAKAEWTGCTVHFVTPELDAGPVIAQTKIRILPTDTEASLSDRLLPLEHQTYVEALKKLSETGVTYRPK